MNHSPVPYVWMYFISQIHGIHANKDLTFFVMDLLGESLHDVFKKHHRKIEPTQTINYAKQMLELVWQIH